VVRHWVHGEHLLFEGRKMSKSAGNVVLVSDVVGRGLDPLALRLAFLQHRYRQQMNLTWEVLTASDSTLSRWRLHMAEWAEQPSAAMPTEAVGAIVAALQEDLDTPRAITMLRDLDRDDSVAPGARFEAFAYLDRVLGLDLARDVGRAPVAPRELPEAAVALLEQRRAARESKDWAASDRLREALAALGVTVIDSAEGQQVQS
jgi:cysteinyl-tRNA synthetase